MSMRTYAAVDYGLYIQESDLQSYADKHDFDVADVGDDSGMTVYSEAEGECWVLTKSRENDSFGVDDYFYMASLSRFPTLFEQAYKDEAEALAELKATYGKYLPEDFDYEGKFVHFVGTIFG